MKKLIVELSDSITMVRQELLTTPQCIITATGAPRGYKIYKSDIEVKKSPNEELMERKIWL